MEAALIHGLDASTMNFSPGKDTVPFRRNGKPYKHQMLREFKRKYVDGYFTFSIVRNPWDRIVSRYFWEKQLARKAVGRYDDFRSYILARRGLPVSEWNVDGDNPRKYTTQFDHLELGGRVAVDKVYRFECLEQDFVDIAARLGITGTPLVQVFTSKHQPYWTYYDDETREIVALAYRDDVENFSYKFLND